MHFLIFFPDLKKHWFTICELYCKQQQKINKKIDQTLHSLVISF